MAGKKKDDKKSMAKMLGTGGARKAADAFINRHNVIDAYMDGPKPEKKKKK